MTGKALLALVLALAPACGTRVEQAGAPAGTSSATGPVQESPVTSPPPAASPSRPAPGEQAKAGPAGPASMTSPHREPALTAPSPIASAPGVGRPPAPPEPGTPSAPIPRGGATAKAPVVVASVGTLSGPVGGTLLPAVRAVQMWARHVNARGGVAGHEIKLLTFDDGGDPARHRALVQQAVEQERAIAFVQNNELLTGGPSVEYINAQRIPVIGVDTGEEWPSTSPMYFPQASTGLANSYTELGAAADVAIPAGKTKLGYVTCVEVDLCRAFGRMVDQQAAALGFEVVHRSQVTLTQPDFTAECLTARNAGAQVLLLAFDTNTIGRLAASCARQSYRPLYAISASMVADRLKDDPNLDGLVAATNVFPYFRSGTPATDEFDRVFRRLGNAADAGVALATGWVSAKLFERAVAGLVSAPPTSAALLESLWTIQGEDLGGMTLPLTFVRDSPPPARSCWFVMRVHHRAWVDPGGPLRCRS